MRIKKLILLAGHYHICRLQETYIIRCCINEGFREGMNQYVNPASQRGSFLLTGTSMKSAKTNEFGMSAI